MKPRLLTMIASAAFVFLFAVTFARADMSSAEYFARDRANNWTGHLYDFTTPKPTPYGRLHAVRPDRSQYVALVAAEARRQGAPVNIVVEQVRQESGFNPGARSRQNALGLMQILPGTWKATKCTGDIWDAADNARCGVRYFMLGLKANGGNVRAALHHYHGGPNLAMHGRRTRSYADVILARAGAGAPVIASTHRPTRIARASRAHKWARAAGRYARHSPTRAKRFASHRPRRGREAYYLSGPSRHTAYSVRYRVAGR